MLADVCFLHQGGGGGVIYMESGPSLRITDTTMDENNSDRGSGGALRLNTVGKLVLDGVSFRYNTVGVRRRAFCLSIHPSIASFSKGVRCPLPTYQHLLAWQEPKNRFHVFWKLLSHLPAPCGL